MLNEYLANIYIVKNNLENLYFNTIGEDKYKIISKKIILDFNNIFFNISILIKKIGGNPIMNLEKINKISKIKQINSKDYTPKETINLLLKNYNTLNNINTQVGEYSLKMFNLRSINLTLNINNYLQERIKELNKLITIKI